ncbi:hypothetical protein Aca07nite_56370 [Actinoplanes capillaceus]|uniref:IstB-like ATP-binding domain-containing protein n=1 Tax=Actinoplanes campanulatus TaxID=113559 RepID=A0ABQ3WQ66_9ACTN|nr:hypothetical protein Aca07nite_56370 [Actinoplanes capillaceus]
MLFQVLTEREEKASVALASNEAFSGWTRTFTGPRLCSAIVDRLTFGGNIIETGTDSDRLAQTRARAEKLDTLDPPADAKVAFGTYVRAHSVLLRPHAYGTHRAARHLSWRGLPRERTNRICPVCATHRNRGTMGLLQLGSCRVGVAEGDRLWTMPRPAGRRIQGLPRTAASRAPCSSAS